MQIVLQLLLLQSRGNSDHSFGDVDHYGVQITGDLA